jgi:hypothetical protein
VAANIADILALLDRLRDSTDPRVREAIPTAEKQIREYAQDQDIQQNNLRTSLSQSLAQIDALIADQSQKQATIASQAQEIADLKAKLAQINTVSTATPLNLATAFKTVIDTIQAQARQTPGVATTIKSMDIEVKGLVQVKDDQTTTLVLPAAGAPIDPHALSTLRVSFGAIPVAAPAAAAPPPPHGAPAPPPAQPPSKKPPG